MQKKKSILFISPYLPSESTGHAGAQLIFRNLKVLAENYEIILITFINSDELEKIHDLTVLGIKVFYRVFERNVEFNTDILKFLLIRISIVVRAIFNLEPFYAAKYFNSNMWSLVQEVAEKYDLSTVQIEYNIMNHYVDIFPNIKKILNLHDISTELNRRRYISEKNPFKKGINFFTYLLWNNYESRILKKFDTLITLTKENKNYLKRWGNHLNIKVIPPQIKVHKIKTGKHKEFKLVFVGSLNREPNIQAVKILIEKIFPEIYTNYSHCRLDIAGRYLPLNLKLKIQASSNMNYLGFVENIDEFISKAILMIAPIYIGSGLKMKIPHALACGVPVLTTPIGAEGIDVSEDDGLFIANDPQEMIKKGLKLLSDSEKLINFGTRGKNRVLELFSKESITNKLSGLY